jgi:NAD(P)-dependent dehydrogenase (short-subunit alcohol dehydrogenase family)
VIRIGRGVGREAVRQAVERGGAATVIYDDVLEAHDIRETLAGIRAAGMPRNAAGILAWIASHPNSPEDVLRDLLHHGAREVLVSLAMNRNLPQDLRLQLLDHSDEDVREYAHKTFVATARH